MLKKYFITNKISPFRKEFGQEEMLKGVRWLGKAKMKVEKRHLKIL
jgi:hypothetical protein